MRRVVLSLSILALSGLTSCANADYYTIDRAARLSTRSETAVYAKEHGIVNVARSVQENRSHQRYLERNSFGAWSRHIRKIQGR